MIPGDFYLSENSAYSFRILFGTKRLLGPRYPKVGDIVAFYEYSSDTHTHTGRVSRCLGLPGQTVELRDGDVYINGERFHEPPTVRRDTPADMSRPLDRVNWGPARVPAETIFAMSDSRMVGFKGGVGVRDLIGRVSTIYFSWDPTTHHPRWERIGQLVDR